MWKSVHWLWRYKLNEVCDNLLDSENFDVCRNVTVLIITILDCSKIDMEVSDTGMETIGTNDCRELSEDDKNTNGILATI